MADTQLSPLFTWRSILAGSRTLPANARLVGLVLSLHMNETGGSCHPGTTRLAQETGLSLRSVKAHLKILQEQGYLVVVERGGLRGEHKRANGYMPAVPDGYEPGEWSHPWLSSSVQLLHPSEPDRCKSRHPPVQILQPTGAPPAPQDVLLGRHEDARARDAFCQRCNGQRTFTPDGTGFAICPSGHVARSRDLEVTSV